MSRRRTAPPGTRQRGAALITALLLAALAAVMTAGMLWREWGAIQREQAARDSEQARWILRGAVDWARLILNEAARHTRVVALDQPWAIPLAESDLSRFLAAGRTDALSRAWMEGRIEDAQSRFNLTNLATFGKPSPNALLTMQRLCAAAGVNPGLARTLADAVAAAQAPGSKLLPIRELQDVARISPALAEALPRLAPYVTVLPRTTPVNVNTADAKVLEAVLDIPPDQTARLVARRKRQHFETTDDVKSFLGATVAGRIDTTLIGTESDFFYAFARVRIGDFEYAERALIQRVGMFSQLLRIQRVAPWLADPGR
ncbi:MAG: type II secretion system minor pseudopilin GspK [Betaproteobacteria bacterium]|nr:type II secretion system minor pseudopilin GspK [Betaproteobacteria bacterium]